LAEVFFPFALDLPASNAAALEFLEMNLLNLGRLTFPLDAFTPSGANFNALDKFDLDTPKIVAVSVRLRLGADPGAASAV
jgi:hypothetical protein